LHCLAVKEKETERNTKQEERGSIWLIRHGREGSLKKKGSIKKRKLYTSSHRETGAVEQDFVEGGRRKGSKSSKS